MVERSGNDQFEWLWKKAIVTKQTLSQNLSGGTKENGEKKLRMGVSA
jgi:hypothetical protein